MYEAKKGPLVSIIMPAYRAASVIGESIDSVISQSYMNWELLVIDDCSTDGTREIVSRFAQDEPRVKLIALEKNHGAPAAPRNIGIRAAKGDWVAFLDADDIWHPKKLMLQMTAIQNSKALFCSTKMLDFTDNSVIIFEDCPAEIDLCNISFYTQLRKFRTPTSSVVVQRDLVIKYPFNEDIEYKAREDFECWLRVHEEIGSSIKLLAPLLYYRIIEGQISGSKIKMTFKTFMVLSRYRLKSGESLGWKKYYYLFTQTIYSVYFRWIKSSL